MALCVIMTYRSAERKDIAGPHRGGGSRQLQELVAGLAAPLVEAHLLVALGAPAVPAALGFLGVRPQAHG
jgi:hypothetical protein